MSVAKIYSKEARGFYFLPFNTGCSIFASLSASILAKMHFAYYAKMEADKFASVLL